MIDAARVARTFQLDPVAVLEERDPLRASLRLAAHNVIMSDEKRAADAARSTP